MTNDAEIIFNEVKRKIIEFDFIKITDVSELMSLELDKVEISRLEQKSMGYSSILMDPAFHRLRNKYCE